MKSRACRVKFAAIKINLQAWGLGIEIKIKREKESLM